MAFAELVKAIQRADKPMAASTSRRLYGAMRDGWVEARTRAYDDTDDGGRYPGLYFRASELHLLCPRMVALARREPLVQVHEMETLWNFALGHAYHTALQQALGSLPNGIFHGWWQREGCSDVRKGPNESPIAKPQGDGWGYVEMQVLDYDWHFRGHVDGALHWPDRKELLEIKSINSHQIDRVNPEAGGLPFENHLIQLNGYMMHFGYEYGRIVYVIKSSDSLATIMFEHEVARDPVRCDGIRAVLKECAQAREMGRQGALPKKLTACCKASTARAQQCPAQKRCFKAIG